MRRSLLVLTMLGAAVVATLAVSAPAGATPAADSAMASRLASSCSGPCPIVVFGKGNTAGTIEAVTEYANGPADVKTCTVVPGDSCIFFIDDASDGGYLNPVSTGFRGWEGCPGATFRCPLLPGFAGSLCVAFTTTGTDPAPSACPPPFLQVYKKGDGKGIIDAHAPSGVIETCTASCPAGVWTRFTPNETVTLTATPTVGRFERWELCPDPAGNQCRVPLTNVATVCAVFVSSTPPTDASCPALTPVKPRDRVAPVTRITAGPSSTRATRSRRATLRFASNEAMSTFLCRIDAKAWLPCRSPKTYLRLKPGLHTFRVRAIDRAGNMDATPATRRWRIKA